MKDTDYMVSKIDRDIEILKDASVRQNETIQGLSIGYERINNAISKIIDTQDKHEKKLQDMEALSIVSRHWKFILFIILAIVVISLSIHTSLKEVIGWVM